VYISNISVRQCLLYPLLRFYLDSLSNFLHMSSIGRANRSASDCSSRRLKINKSFSAREGERIERRDASQRRSERGYFIFHEPKCRSELISRATPIARLRRRNHTEDMVLMPPLCIPGFPQNLQRLLPFRPRAPNIRADIQLSACKRPSLSAYIARSVCQPSRICSAYDGIVSQIARLHNNRL